MKYFQKRSFSDKSIQALAIVTISFVLSAFMVFADEINNQVNVGNATPTIGTITINGGAAINVTEDTTTVATTSVTVSDANGCSTLGAVTLDFYRSGIGAAACDTAGEANNNNCYPVVSCTATTTGNSCTGGADTSVEYDCGVDLQ